MSFLGLCLQLSAIGLLVSACQSGPGQSPMANTESKPVKGSQARGVSTLENDGETDPYLWLEEIESDRALEKVRGWNSLAQKELESDPRYKGIESDIRKILLAKDRIPTGTFFGGYLYNFWQDEKNVRGLWRRTTLSEYKKASPKWEVIIDVDDLAKKENENWVWKRADCRAPEYDRCLVHLSRGGKDAVVVKEFDLKTKTFVENGFQLPEAKSSIDWIDKDTVFVGTDFGPGSMTKAGYTRQTRIWKRGQPLEETKVLYEGSEDDVWIGGYSMKTPVGNYSVVERGISFNTHEEFLVDEKGDLKKLPIPLDFIIKTVFQHRLIGILRSDLQSGTRLLKTGSIVAYDLRDFNAAPVLIMEPGERDSIESVVSAKDHVFIQMYSNVKGRLLRASLSQNGEWKIETVKTPDNGDLEISSSDPFSDTLIVNFSSFLVPSSIYSVVDKAGALPKLDKLKSAPARFNAKGLIVEQYETASRDGVMIPYFIIRPKNLKFDGKAPTLLYGYGGFKVSETPFYLNATGKVFSEKGGVFVLANIRGGGEFGPKWHQAALQKNRQKAFDDFIAIAEDLIRRKVTSPQHLGIKGGSNGGLLVGSVFVQRPDLYNAVVCQVPLLDMLRYHKLLAGFSWVDEYGNPDDPSMAEYIKTYSPYQNVIPDKKYPRIFIMTSTKDDRVHPGHARKMAARLEEYKHPFLYYENIEGGHGAAANIEQRIHFSSLEWTYLWKQLGGK